MSYYFRGIVFLGVVLVMSITTLSHTDAVKCTDIGYGYAQCQTPFIDITANLYKTAIEYVQEKDIVQGYADNTYKPEQAINRAEFTKILLGAVEGAPADTTEDCFSDVPHDQWFAKFVCRAKTKNIIGGYPDGTFGPGKNINIAEAAKILVNSFSLSTDALQGADQWYFPFIKTLADKKAIPQTITKVGQLLTRGEMAEMIMRLKETITDQSSPTACDLISELCPPGGLSGYGDETLLNVDMEKVRQTWISWYNTERAKLGLAAYAYNSTLNKTAYLWSDYSKQRGYMDHKRPGQTAYYDYDIIKKWFQDLGVEFENVNTVTFTENIGWGPYHCSESDCTDTLINTIRSTFDFYMAEKGTASTAHYNSVMNKYFKVVGLGIALDKQAGRYYLTVHYGTKIISP